MRKYRTGCLICGKDLKYFDPAIMLTCELCGIESESAVSCEDGHFICDACHTQAGYKCITANALCAKSKNPLAIASEMMKNPLINMHGPEHHYLIVAALLAAYKNSGGNVYLEKSLSVASQRAQKIPGGVCGFWGSCGAGIGTGIFISIITGATPLSVNEWRLANKISSLSLDVISQNGGPRCCKRNCFLAILTAIDFAAEHMKTSMEKPEAVRCLFFNNNPACKKHECLFYK